MPHAQPDPFDVDREYTVELSSGYSRIEATTPSIPALLNAQSTARTFHRGRDHGRDLGVDRYIDAHECRLTTLLTDQWSVSSPPARQHRPA